MIPKHEGHETLRKATLFRTKPQEGSDHWLDLGVGCTSKPQLSICDIGPTKCCMKHHRARHRHDGLNGSFGQNVVVMSSHASKLFDLSKIFQLVCVLVICEATCIVGQVRLCNCAMILKPVFEFQFGSKSFMRCHSNLHVYEDGFRSMIDEEGSSRIHLRVSRLSS